MQSEKRCREPVWKEILKDEVGRVKPSSSARYSRVAECRSNEEADHGDPSRPEACELSDVPSPGIVIQRGGSLATTGTCPASPLSIILRFG